MQSVSQQLGTTDSFESIIVTVVVSSDTQYQDDSAPEKGNKFIIWAKYTNAKQRNGNDWFVLMTKSKRTSPVSPLLN